MSETKAQIQLVPGVDDAELHSTQTQDELRDFSRALQEGGVNVSPSMFFRDSAPGTLGLGAVTFLGEYGVPLAQIAIPAVSAALVAWITTRGNRRVRLKVGAIEAEARTPEDVEKLLQQALQIQKELDASKSDEP
jgi:hypothetical protein